MNELHRVARTLGPWGAGLAGYDADDRLLVVLVVNTKKPVEWARRGVSKPDWRRVQQALDELKGEDADQEEETT